MKMKNPAIWEDCGSMLGWFGIGSTSLFLCLILVIFDHLLII